MTKSKQKKFRKIKGTPFWVQQLPDLTYGVFGKGVGMIRRFWFDPRNSALQVDKFKQALQQENDLLEFRRLAKHRQINWSEVVERKV